LETDASGAVEASYVLAGPELISQRRAGSTSYYLHDAQGSVRGLADTAGEITDQYTYAAFGELVEQEGATDNPYLHTGQQYDEASGLYSLRARYYDPTVGRFLSRDPLEQWRNVRELNRYSYAANNPVNRTDPTGRQAMAELTPIQQLAVWWVKTVAGRFVSGAVTGLLWTFLFFHMGVSGMCGDRVKDQTLAMGWRWLLWFVLAAAGGGALGALAGSPIASMRATAGAFMALFGAIGAGTSGADMLLHWEVSICNLLGLALSVYAMWRGLALVHESLPQSAGGQAQETAQEQKPCCADCDSGPTRPETIDEAYHHTYSKWVESIETEGLWPDTYATPIEGLSPSEAQEVSSLDPSRRLTDVVIRIDVAGLRAAGCEIPPITTVVSIVGTGPDGSIVTMPGGGLEMQFPYPIPPEFI
jgi:RHS repeat-associated protein